MSLFSVGQPVTTPKGPGVVGYVRMGGPEYRTPTGVSVFLDAKRTQPGYAGTLFAFTDVTSTESAQETEAREQLDEHRSSRRRRGLRRW